MARKRMIDPNIWNSCYEKKLKSNDFTVLVAAISAADDEGRGKISHIQRNVEKMLTPAQFKNSLNKLFDTIIPYDKNLYFLPNWKDYQKINRPSESKYPTPPPELLNEYSMNDHKTINDDSSLIEDNRKEVNEIEVKGNDEIPQPQQMAVKLFSIWGRAPDNGEKLKCENLLKQFNYDFIRIKDAFIRASELSSRGKGNDKRNLAYVRGVLEGENKKTKIGRFEKPVSQI